MLAPHARVTRRASWLGGTALLLIALAIALPLDGALLFHSHSGGSAAIYNGNCPLAAVAACHSVGLPVATVSPVLLLVPAGAAALAPGARLFTPVARHTDPRAPPLV
jgi:hypothetical protein